MGSASSKFKKYLQHGDEYAAMQVYQSSAELRKALQPNFSYGDHHGHNTPLHYAARHGMKHLIRTFINDLDGNPNKRNSARQTALHCVCKVTQQKSPSALERRAYSVILLLSWRGPLDSNNCSRERIEVNAQDEHGYTALHYAAQSGLRKCIEYLVAHGADLFLESKDGFTPCDLAMRESHHHIAQFLESKMVFSGTPESVSGESSGARTSSFEGEEEVYCGLRAQDLQEAKDQLLVETADMLHIPLFTAEALLRHAEWSRENLLDHWIRDPVRTCQQAGVQPPYSALRHSPLSQYEQIAKEYHEQQRILQKQEILAHKPRLTPKIYSENSFIADEELEEDGLLCEICCDLMTPHPSDNEMSCGHKFCSKCWKNYLHNKIQEGNTRNISCQAYNCNILVPVQVIERHVSPQMARKYLKFDIDAFVETNRSIKWCPYPSCQRAVNLPESEQSPSVRRPPPSPPGGQQSDASLHSQLNDVSHAVDCGGGHFFCWECGSEAHAPITCPLWKVWLKRCASVDPSELKVSSRDYQEAANCLWLVTHSKPCPSCQSPIQKNDGCNHIKCSKCRHDFCWVCLESWKKHSSATGGYFRCNRYNNNNNLKDEHDNGGAAFDEGGKNQTLLRRQMSENARRLRELNRFAHFYTRYKNHENSKKMEEPLLNSAKKKRELLQSSLAADKRSYGGSTFQQQPDLLAKNTKFYEDGVWELLKARQILCGSYAYGFYLEDNTQSRNIFEFMQNELEEVAENLSEMIARPYLRTPRRTIVQTIHLCRRKRQEFLRACYKGLVPPESQTNSPSSSSISSATTIAISSGGGPNQNQVLQHHPHQQHPRMQQQRASVVAPGAAEIDRKRLVESISDCLHGGEGRGVWTRDVGHVPLPPQPMVAAAQCGKCRRPSCTTQMCASREKSLRAGDFNLDFNSLRRGKPGGTGISTFSYQGVDQHHQHHLQQRPRASPNQQLSHHPPHYLPHLHSHHQHNSGHQHQHQHQQLLPALTPFNTLASSRSNETLLLSSAGNSNTSPPPPDDDYNVDLMIALEMSHLQMIQDGVTNVKPTLPPKPLGYLKKPPKPAPPPRTSKSDDNLLLAAAEDQQVKMAIELSLKEHHHNQQEGPHCRHNLRQMKRTSGGSSGGGAGRGSKSLSSSASSSHDSKTPGSQPATPKTPKTPSTSSSMVTTAASSSTTAATTTTAPSLTPPSFVTRQMKLSSKSISTDGAEGRALPEWGQRDKEGEEEEAAANETVNSFLKNLTLTEMDETAEEEEEETEKEEEEERRQLMSDKGSAKGNGNKQQQQQQQVEHSKSRQQGVAAVNMAGDQSEGKFKISEIHDSGGYAHLSDDAREAMLANLKRSQSTGDMEDYPESDQEGPPIIDSDHCCSEKPEEEFSSSHHHHRRSQAAGTADCESSESTSTDPQPTLPTTLSSTATGEDLSSKFATTLTSGATDHTSVTITPDNPLSTAGTPPVTSKRARPRFVRQKSFEIDSDSTEMDTSLAEQTVAPLVSENPTNIAKQKGKEAEEKGSETAVSNRSAVGQEKSASLTPSCSVGHQSRIVGQFAQPKEEQKKQPNLMAENIIRMKPSSSDAANAARGVEKTQSGEDYVPALISDGGDKPSSHSSVGGPLSPGTEKRSSSVGKKSSKKRRRPELTIKIHNSSFIEDNVDDDTEFGPLTAKSPTLHISGVSISRSPGGKSQAQISPNFDLLKDYCCSSSVINSPAVVAAAAAAASSRNRSSSLVVPPYASVPPGSSSVLLLSSSLTPPAPRSPGSKSLQHHLSRSSSPTTACSVSSRLGKGKQQHSHQLPHQFFSSLAKQPAQKFTFPPPPVLPLSSSSSLDAAETTTTTSSSDAAAPDRTSQQQQQQAAAGGDEAVLTASSAALLSSVLHVHDSSNLSCDDFHEALFLPEKRSPPKCVASSASSSAGAATSGTTTASLRKRRKSKKLAQQQQQQPPLSIKGTTTAAPAPTPQGGSTPPPSNKSTAGSAATRKTEITSDDMKSLTSGSGS